MANEGNLKRGNVQQKSEFGPGGGNPEPGLEAIARNREQDAALLQLDDPDDVTLELFKEASLAALRGYRKANRQRGEPNRQQIEASKEARQLAEVCRDIIRARGAATEARRFFTEMASRITAANLEEGPRPVGEVAR